MTASFQGDVLITDFSGGELSPRWFSRVQGGGIDPLQGGGNVSNTYQSGCRDITNMIVMPQGGVVKRTGTLYGRDLTADIPGVNGANVQVFKFEYPGADFITVWAPNVVRVYSTATFDISVALPAPVFSAATPYDATDISVMQVAQLQDSLIAFDNHHRMRVLRLRQGVWTLVDILDTGTYVAPIYDFRDTLSPPATIAKYTVEFIVNANKNCVVNVSGTGTGFTFGGSLFGAIFAITKASGPTTRTAFENALKTVPAVNPNSVLVTWTGSGTTLTYDVQYTFLGSVGDGTGLMALYLRDPVTGESATVTTVLDGSSGGEPLWSGPGYILKSAVYYKCIFSHISTTLNEPGVGANWTTYWQSLGASLPAGTDWTVENSGKAWTVDQAYGTYNRGWPSTGTAHEQRLVANGPIGARGVIAGSRTGVGQFLNFTIGTNANDAFVFLLVVANGLSVVWLHSQKLLYVGTSVGVFAQTQVPMAPTNVNFSRQSNYSLGDIRGFDVAGEVFFVQRNGRQMRRMQFINDLQAYQASDMTAYSEHLWTEGRRIKDVSYINSPDAILWVLRSDGALTSFTYDRFYGVSAWCKHTTVGGTFSAVEAFFGGAVKKDMLVTCVTRKRWNGSALVDNVYLEVLAETSRNEWGTVPDINTGLWTYSTVPPAQWYSRLDAVQYLIGAGTLTLTVDARFRNKTVVVQQNGVVLGNFLVSTTGVITLPSPTVSGATIYVGYGYPARIIPTELELASKNTAQSQTQRWARPMFRLFASSMPTINGQPIRERSVEDLYDEVSGLYTGDVTIVNLGVGGELVIDANDPLPFQMTGIFGLMSVFSGDA